MADIGGASIKVGLNIADLKTGVDKAKGELNKFNKSIQDNAEKIRAAGAKITIFGAAIVGGLGLAVKAASDLQETTSKFNTVFGAQQKKAEGFVEVLRAGYAMSSTEAKKFLGNMQDLLVPMGMNATAAADMSNEVVKLSADLGSFNNLPTEQVMADIQSALVGNFETMKKYGVVLNETVVKQKALDMGLIKGKETLTAAQKAQVAYALVVEGSTAAIGDMERTSKSWANQSKFLKARLTELVETVGVQLLPILDPVLQRIVKLVSAFSDWIGENEGLFRYLTLTVGALGGIAAVVGPLLIMLPSLAGGFTMVTGAVAGLTTLLAANPIILILTGIATAGVLLYKNFSGTLDQMQSETDSAIERMKVQSGKVDAAFADTGKTFNQLLDESKGKVGEMGDAVVVTLGVIEESAKTGGAVINESYQKFLKKMKDSEDKLKEESDNVQTYLAENVRGYTGNIKKMVEDSGTLIIESANKVKEADRKTKDEMLLNTQKFITNEEQARQTSFENNYLEHKAMAEKMKLSLEDYEKKFVEGTLPAIEKAQKASIFNVKFDWDQHLNSMANATAAMVLDRDFNFSTLKDAISTVFTDIKTTIIGNFRQIVAEYITGFIKNMLIHTGTLATGISTKLGGVVTALTGVAGGGASGGTAAAGGSAVGGVIATVAASTAAVVAGFAAVAYGISKWFKDDSLTYSQRARFTEEELRIGKMEAERARSDIAIASRGGIVTREGFSSENPFTFDANAFFPTGGGTDTGLALREKDRIAAEQRRIDRANTLIRLNRELENLRNAQKIIDRLKVQTDETFFDDRPGSLTDIEKERAMFNVRQEASSLIGNLNINIAGNVDDPAEFARLISDEIAKKTLQRVSFAES